MVLRRDVAARASTSTTLGDATRTRTRCSGCSTSSSSARSPSALAEALGDGRPATRRRRAAEVLEAEVDDVATSPARSRCSTALAGAGDRRVAALGRASPGRSAARGLAVVTDAGDGGGGLDPGRRCSPTPRGRARRLVAATARRPRPRRQGADAGAARPRASTSRGLALDTAIAAYLLDPAEARYALDDLLERYTPLRSCPPTTPAPRASSTSTARGVDDGRRAGRERSPSTRLVEPLDAALDAQGMAELYDDDREPAGRACWPGWSTSASRVDVAELRALNDRLTAESTRSAPRSADGRRARRSTSTPRSQLREILFDELGLRPEKKTKTGLLDRRRVAREAARTSDPSSSSRCCATARSRSCAAPTARGCSPRSRADGRIHATFNQTVARTGRLSAPTSRTCTTSRCARDEGRAVPQGVRRRPPGCELLVADYNQIELRCIAHLAEDPGLIDAFDQRAGHPHRHRGARVRRRARRRSRSSSGRRRRWCRYGLAYGMEAYGLGQRLEHPDRGGGGDPRRVLRGLPEREGATWTARSSRPASAATPRRCSAAAGRSPSCSTRNFRIRQAGERQAMNAGIQGLAADIFKVALVRIDDALRGRRRRQPARSCRCTTRCCVEVPEAEHGASVGAARRRPDARRRRARRAARGQRRLGRRPGPTPRA